MLLHEFRIEGRTFSGRVLKSALHLVDVAVLDYCVVGWPELYSMADHGLLEWKPGTGRAAPAGGGVRASAQAVT